MSLIVTKRAVRRQLKISVLHPALHYRKQTVVAESVENSVTVISMQEEIPRDEKGLFRRFCPLLAFNILQNNTRLRGDYIIKVGKNGMYSGNDGILDFSEIYEVALCIYFESEGPITQITL
jgi:hypothetical protein